MRILQVSPGFPPDAGGVERHVQAVSSALTARGHEVTVLALGSDDATPDEPESARTPMVLRHPSRDVGPFALPLGLGAHVRALAGGHDVVHVHNLHSPLPLITLRALRSSRVPVVVSPHFHGGGHSVAASLVHPPYRMVMRPHLPLAAGLVFVSQAEKDRFASYFRPEELPGVSHQVIHNGVRPAPVGIAVREPLVISLGRLEPYKRVDSVIMSMARLPAGSPWKLVVVGDGPDLPRLRTLAGASATQGRVEFAGHLPESDLDALLVRASAAVSASRHEAFGMAALDAAAAGLHVLASDIPAHRELTGLTGRITLWDGEPATFARFLDGVEPDTETPDTSTPDTSMLPSWETAAVRLEQLYTTLAGTPSRSVR